MRAVNARGGALMPRDRRALGRRGSGDRRATRRATAHRTDRTSVLSRAFHTNIARLYTIIRRVHPLACTYSVTHTLHICNLAFFVK